MGEAVIEWDSEWLTVWAPFFALIQIRTGTGRRGEKNMGGRRG